MLQSLTNNKNEPIGSPISYLIVDFVDFAGFRSQLPKLHGLAEGLSDSGAGLGGDKRVPVVAQVSADYGSDRRLWRHTG